MKVFILGISGWIGNSLQKRLKAKGIEVAGSWCYTKPPHPVKGVQFNQQDPVPLFKFLDIWQPDVVIHLLEGLTEDAFRLHAQLCDKAKNDHFNYTYLSASASLDRSEDKSDKAEPKASSRYGQFKASCEQIMANVPNSLIVRSATCHGAAEHKSTRTTDFFDHLKNGEEIFFPDLLVQNRVWIEDLTTELTDLTLDKKTGCVHIAGSEGSNELEFRKDLAEAFGYKPSLVTCGEHSEANLSLDSSNNQVLSNKDLIQKLLNDPLLQEYKA